MEEKESKEPEAAIKGRHLKGFLHFLISCSEKNKLLEQYHAPESSETDKFSFAYVLVLTYSLTSLTHVGNQLLSVSLGSILIVLESSFPYL